MHGTLLRLFCAILTICCLLGNVALPAAEAASMAESAAPEAAVSLQGVNSLFTANDRLYANCWGGLYRLDEQAEHPMHVLIAEEEPSAHTELPNFQKVTACQNTFYAFGNPGEQGVLYTLTLSGDTLGKARALATFPAPEGENAYCDCTALVADETAVWALLSVSDMASPYNTTTLYRVNKADGAVAKLDMENLTDLCAYRDGFLLARQWDQQAAARSPENLSPTLVSIDKASLSVTPLATLPDDRFSAPAYDAQNDFIYLASPSKLIRLDSGFQEEICAYLALRSVGDGMPVILWKGRYLLAFYDAPNGFIRSATDPALMPKQVLKIAKSNMDNTTLAFCNEHPEIPVSLADHTYFSTDKIIQGMLAASDEIDVYSLYLGMGSFAQLVKKGYCLDLSGSEILTQAVGRMSPALTAACYHTDGRLCALPYRASADDIGYSPSALQKLGFTQDDLPRTYLELMDFAALWMDEYSDNEAGLTLFDSVYDIRSQLISRLDNAYINRALARGEPLDFDTPLYRTLLAKLNEVTPSLLPLNPEDEYDGSGPYVIYEDNNDAPSLFTFFAPITPRGYLDYDYVPLMPTLEVGGDPVFEATVQVLFINPYSQNQDAALRYLEYAAEHIDPYNAIVLFPDQNDPIEDSFYQQDAAGSDATIANLRERLSAADEANKSALEEELANEISWREALEARRWRVSAEQIATYRQLEPYVILNANNVLANASVADVRSRYSAGALTDDQYIAELERVLRMKRLENQ